MNVDDVAAELVRRRDLDQQARRNAPAGRWTQRERDHARGVDAANTRWLAALVAEHGWPRTDQVGEAAAHAAWLIAQHADAAPAQQQRFLTLMRQATADGQARPADLAYLEDRCRRNSERPQLYGTQVTITDDGEVVPAPLEEPQTVDDRRAAVGLPRLADYLESFREHNQ
ncbi:DUF6624 domain-containing protein [Actinomadura litoris]|uniref:DUF6624 domain-containing protein n=1 Tax=Actinomadura litoris TaxID=2678616 RepID=UPI001FA70DDE|nr:DUF6624 domain-containing protein [Actinomadura litoris]